jgi:hypothetical protein
VTRDSTITLSTVFGNLAVDIAVSDLEACSNHHGSDYSAVIRVVLTLAMAFVGRSFCHLVD